jgi:hypothetical protein
MVKPLLSLGLLVLLAALPPAQILLNARPVSTDIQVPFDRTVTYDLPPFESLAFTGSMHVNSQVTPKGSLKIRVNLDNMSAIGETTGIRYNATGRDELTAPFDTSITEDFDFKIIPADGFTLSCILRVKLVLTFTVSGELADVDIDDVSVVAF